MQTTNMLHTPHHKPVSRCFRSGASKSCSRLMAPVRTSRSRAVRVAANSSDPPVRQALSALVSSIYRASAGFQAVDPSLPPLWQGLRKLDKAAVAAAIKQGASPDEQNAAGDTPLLYIAREGHYKYPPAEIPTLLVQSGANMEATDSSGRSALQVSLLSGWQNIAELLIQNGANTDGVAVIKSQITCPECKKIAARYN